MGHVTQAATLRARGSVFDPGGLRRCGDFYSLRAQTGSGAHSNSYKSSTADFPGVKDDRAYSQSLYFIIVPGLRMCGPLRPPLWSRGNIVTSHLAGSGSIPGRVSFPG